MRGPKPASTVLTPTEEAATVLFRQQILLPIDDYLYALQAAIPHLSRSALHRCFQRHGIGRLLLSEELGETQKKKFKHYSIGYLCVDFAEVQTEEGKQYLCIAQRFTKPAHPRTNGQIERMNRTVKEATIKRLHYETTDQLNTHLQAFLHAYNFAKRLKRLHGLTPCEFICAEWRKNSSGLTV